MVKKSFEFKFGVYFNGEKLNMKKSDYGSSCGGLKIEGES